MFERFRKNKHRHKIPTALLVGTSVVLFWRGVWGLLDIYLFPNDQLMSYTTSVVLGIVILYYAHYLTEELM